MSEHQWGSYPDGDKKFICQEIKAIAQGKRTEEQKNSFIRWLEDSGEALERLKPKIIKSTP